jgi:hypothetical protein
MKITRMGATHWFTTMTVFALSIVPAIAANSITYFGANPNSYAPVFNTPANLSNVVAIALGRFHTVALTAEGKVVVWGDYSDGKTNVPPSLHHVTAIAAGLDFTAALDASGHVSIWGPFGVPWNSATDPTPSNVDHVVSIACGQGHVLALKSDSTVVAWGPAYLDLQNFNGLSNIVAVGAGDIHALAVRSDGTVVNWQYWGWQPTPSEATNVVAVAGGFSHSLALRSDGTIVAWGPNNNHGILDVPAEATNIVAIAARGYSNVALRNDGTIITWGAIGPDQFPFNGPSTNLPNVNRVAVCEYAAAALFDPAPIAPVIIDSPQNQAGGSTFSATFWATVIGGEPLACQWYLNGTNSPITDATNRWLFLDNLQFNDSGNTYTLKIQNTIGTAWSQPASLTVLTSLRLDMVPGPRVRLNGEIGHTYRLEYAHTLASSNQWTTLTNVTLDATPFYYLDDSAAGSLQRFYRAKVMP